MLNENYNINHTICRCNRWWTSLREAIEYGGYNCIDGVKSCDYCRDNTEGGDDEET